MGFPRSQEKLDRLIIEGSAPLPMLAALIGADPLLTAQVLGQANSTSATEITQLSAAMIHLGLGSVHGLVKGELPIPEPRRHAMAGCWALAQATATMTRVLADYCAPTMSGSYDHETLHAAGLLHDLGTIVAHLHFSEPYERALQRLDQHGTQLNQLMRDELGTDAIALGTLLATYWRLPPTITACIRYHATPLRCDGHHELISLVHVSRGLVRSCGYVAGTDRFLDPFDDGALALLKIYLSDIERVLEQFYDEMDDLELYEGVLAKG